MKNKEYTKQDLLKVLEGYRRMIERSGGEYPAVVLDDIHKSIMYILKNNRAK